MIKKISLLIVIITLLFGKSDSANSTGNETVRCQISPMVSSVNTTVQALFEDACKLLVYSLSFPDYDQQPFHNMESYYRPDVWYRTTTQHGETLLTLPYNYEMFSLTTLSIGVHKMNVSLSDLPVRCFGNLTDKDRVYLLRELLLSDFGANIKAADSPVNELCNDMIFEGALQTAIFKPQCCSKSESGQLNCVMKRENKWIKFLFVLMEISRVLLIVCGTSLVTKSLFRDDTRAKVKYRVVPDNARNSEDAQDTGDTVSHPTLEAATPGTSHEGQREEHQPASATGARPDSSSNDSEMTHLPSQTTETDDRITTPETSPLTNETTRSITSTETNNRIITLENSLLISETTPPVTFFGIVKDEFLNCRFLKEKADDNDGCCGKKVASKLNYRKTMKGINCAIAFFFIIPIGFIIRCIIFHKWEREAIAYQDAAATGVGLRGPYRWSFWLGKAWPGLAIAIFGVFVISTCMVWFYYRTVDKDQRFELMWDPIYDLRDKSNSRLWEKLMEWVHTPIKKYGGFPGTLLSICIVLLFPCLYILLMGLVLLNFVTGGSIKQCKLPFRGNGQSNQQNETNLKKIFSFNIPILCAVLSLVLMWTESFHCLTYIIVMTSVGAIVNADSIMDYFLLMFWTVVYIYVALQRIQTKYSKFSENLFTFLKQYHKDTIVKVTRHSEQNQKNVALKYFIGRPLPDDENTVLFIDRDDVLRIQKWIFVELCEKLKGPGFPGPIRKSLFVALKDVLVMVLFLMLVYVIVMSFNGVIRLTSSNQMLLTLASGFLPVILQKLKPKVPDVRENKEILQGKLEEILLSNENHEETGQC